MRTSAFVCTLLVSYKIEPYERRAYSHRSKALACSSDLQLISQAKNMTSDERVYNQK